MFELGPAPWLLIVENTATRLIGGCLTATGLTINPPTSP